MFPVGLQGPRLPPGGQSGPCAEPRPAVAATYVQAQARVPSPSKQAAQIASPAGQRHASPSGQAQAAAQGKPSSAPELFSWQSRPPEQPTGVKSLAKDRKLMPVDLGSPTGVPAVAAYLAAHFGGPEAAHAAVGPVQAVGTLQTVPVAQSREVMPHKVEGTERAPPAFPKGDSNQQLLTSQDVHEKLEAERALWMECMKDVHARQIKVIEEYIDERLNKTQAMIVTLAESSDERFHAVDRGMADLAVVRERHDNVRERHDNTKELQLVEGLQLQFEELVSRIEAQREERDAELNQLVNLIETERAARMKADEDSGLYFVQQMQELRDILKADYGGISTGATADFPHRVLGELELRLADIEKVYGDGRGVSFRQELEQLVRQLQTEKCERIEADAKIHKTLHQLSGERSPGRAPIRVTNLDNTMFFEQPSTASTTYTYGGEVPNLHTEVPDGPYRGGRHAIHHSLW